MLANFINPFTVGFATGLMSYFQLLLKYVTTLPYKIQKFNNSNTPDVLITVS